MYKYIFLVCAGMLAVCAKAQTVSSPDKSITVTLNVNAGKPVYSVTRKGEPVIAASALGIDQSNGNFYSGLKLKSSKSSMGGQMYSMVNAKKHHINYKYSERVYSLLNAAGKQMDVIFRVSDDGVAFRYYFPDGGKNDAVINKEFTEYHFAPATKTWLQPKAEPKSGWEHTNPSYEENYDQDVTAGKSAKNGWIYPALFKTGNNWALITEAGQDGSYCGTTLKNDSGSSKYKIGFPDAREIYTGRDLLPKNVTYTPWRVITIGSLKTIVESTLGTDVAPPAISLKDTSIVKPGKAAWSWIMSKDDSITYTEQIRYVDLANKMNWQYCLVDADWDRKIGYDKIKQLADYAKTKNVGILLWYNSAGPWNTVKYTPKDKLLTHEEREKEFTRLKEMGIKGVKIDFFGGDGRSMIQYYIDILNDAAAHGLLVNFHGATLPRGWARTYPNLMTTEAVKGFEMVTFGQGDADKQANHCAMLPFTRNAFDPMDFTPMNLYKIPTQVKRKTTSGFELATSVVFLSGIQHYAESPEGMSHQPEYVVSFLQNLPNYWDDVRFVDGYPGKYAVIARKSGNKWYIAGINGENDGKEVTINLKDFKATKAKLIADGAEPLTFTESNVPTNNPAKITMKGNGGFVIVLE